jgi:competence protein CoiA
MMLALVDGQRVTAEPKLPGHCPNCGGAVIAKCGPINAWHWAHKAADCDTWAERFTQWHADWQELFPPDSREITIGNHRADVRSPTGLVIEFQHSALSADEIRERENHYGRMLWVFDAVYADETDRLDLRAKRGRDGSEYWSFRWKHPRRSILACRRPVFLDLGGWSQNYDCRFHRLLELKRMYPNAPNGGWGHLRAVDEFLVERCGLEYTYCVGRCRHRRAERTTA